MTGFKHDLPAGVIPWLENLGSGQLTRLQRHVARREAWVVDISREDGSVLEGFLRIDRAPVEGSNVSLRKEARICEALMATDIPAPGLLGWNEEHHAALFTRDPGSADLPAVQDPRQQRAIMEDFMRVIARLHRLELNTLGLDDIMGPRPTSPAESALGDLNVQLQRFAGFLKKHHDPLLAYGVDWLRRFVPEQVARVSLVQGDTGPVNFMFQQDRVSAVVDWEWGHWGDPMEDLGNICVREFWNPSGGLDGLFRLYEAESGIPYTRFSAQYYRVQQNVRGMIPIHFACSNPSMGESLAWYLCYRYIGDRATAEALAEAMNVPVTVPEMPEPSGAGEEVLLEAAAQTLARDIEPHVDDAFARSRASDAGILLRCAQRERQLGPALQAIECEEMSELLGASISDVEQGNAALVNAINVHQLEDEPLLQYLARRAYRDEWLYAPAAALYPERRWSALD